MRSLAVELAAVSSAAAGSTARHPIPLLPVRDARFLCLVFRRAPPSEPPTAECEVHGWACLSRSRVAPRALRASQCRRTGRSDKDVTQLQW